MATNMEAARGCWDTRASHGQNGGEEFISLHVPASGHRAYGFTELTADEIHAACRACDEALRPFRILNYRRALERDRERLLSEAMDRQAELAGLKGGSDA